MNRTVLYIVLAILAIILVWLLVLTFGRTTSPQQEETEITPSPTHEVSPTATPIETTPTVSPTPTPLPTRQITPSPTVTP